GAGGRGRRAPRPQRRRQVDHAQGDHGAGSTHRRRGELRPARSHRPRALPDRPPRARLRPGGPPHLRRPDRGGEPRGRAPAAAPRRARLERTEAVPAVSRARDVARAARRAHVGRRAADAVHRTHARRQSARGAAGRALGGAGTGRGRARGARDRRAQAGGRRGAACRAEPAFHRASRRSHLPARNRHHPPAMNPAPSPFMNLERFAWMSVAAAIATIGLKTLAWWLTGSVGLLSDALESIVNLAAALLALTMLRLAASPPSEEHPYGFSKAEYFAAGIEGALIVLAAAGILATAIPRLLHPEPLAAPLLGLGLSAGASLINLGTAIVLLRVGKRHDSITLEADGRHLMTDVW